MALEHWNSDSAYEQYVGRWSRKVALEFLHWLELPRGLAWGDAGCGTGALASAILTACQPVRVFGFDSSFGFVSQARRRIRDPRASFIIGDASRIPWASAVCDAAVSGLVLNFVRDSAAVAREMMRITMPGGTVAAYVWDYAGGMQMMRHFWDAAIAVSPQDARLDQAERFPLCRPEPLQKLFEQTGLTAVQVQAIDIPTVFQNFADYWTPFLGRTGSAPTYLASLSEDVREQIRAVLHSRLASAQDGPIELSARAWAVQGRV
jgi:SAM-dependent methyltransferase